MTQGDLGAFPLLRRPKNRLTASQRRAREQTGSDRLLFTALAAGSRLNEKLTNKCGNAPGLTGTLVPRTISESRMIPGCFWI